MLIALYENHHQLPFWYKEVTVNPSDIFDPERTGTLVFHPLHSVHKPKPFMDFDPYLYSFLMGLHKVSTPLLMAHVSLLCKTYYPDGRLTLPKRVWVQITTKPNGYKGGLPDLYKFVSNNGAAKRVLDPSIRHVWGGDNGTYSPYAFIEGEDLRGAMRTDHTLWTQFFNAKLAETLCENKAALEIELRAVDELRVLIQILEHSGNQ